MTPKSLATMSTLAAMALVLVQTLAPSDVRADARLEERAALVESLVHFVEWPSDFRPISALEICVAGDRSFTEVLGRTLKGRALRGIPMEARTIGSPASEEGCRVLFLSAQGRRSSAPSGAGLLTIGTEEGFLEQGGVIRLARPREALRFEINLAAARKANLHLDSRILDLAIRVMQGQDQP